MFVCSYGFVTFESQDDAEKVIKRTVRMFLSICVFVVYIGMYDTLMHFGNMKHMFVIYSVL